MMNDFTNWSLENLDRLLIGKFWGLYSLGLYSVAFNLSRAPLGLLVGAVQNIAFASTARLQDDLVSVRKGFLVTITATALATMPLFALVGVESETLLYVLYGPKWIKAAPYMEALAFSIPFISLGSIIAAILRGIGAIGTILRCLLATGVILCSGFVILNGASLSVAVWVIPAAYFVNFLLLLAAIRKRLQLRIADVLLSFRGAFLLAVVGVGVSAALVNWVPQATIICAGVLPLLAAASAIMLLFGLGFSWFLGKPLMAVVRTQLSRGSVWFR
jgi:O-antigen/teichoic acid export membrane protein